MSKPLVTVIIPVFNAEKYLAEALESVRKQSYPLWEICAVDDGSSDSSPEILRAFAEKEPRLHWFSQDNAGAADARFQALKEAKGELVFCLDADDVLSEDLLEKVVEKHLQSQADVVLPDMEMYWTSRRAFRWNKRKKIDTQQVLSGEEAFAATFPWKIHALMLVETQLMREYYTPSELPERCFCTDEFLSRKILLNAQKVVFSEGVYFYRYNPQSVTQQFDYYRFDEIAIVPIYLSLAQKTAPEVQIRMHGDLVSMIFHQLSQAYRWKRKQGDQGPIDTTMKMVLFFQPEELRPLNGKQRIIFLAYRLHSRLFFGMAFIRSFWK